jgi:hypothetical protein
VIAVEIVPVSEGKWRVRSSPEKEWREVFLSGSAGACSCPGWTFRQRRYAEFKCAHIKAVEETLPKAVAV